MSLELTSLRTGRRLNWGRVLGLLLVPLTVAGVLLWGLWNPQDRLDTITAAVVNHDEPVEVDGQLVPLGRVLAGELISPSSDAGDTEQNLTWVLTDDEDAEQGLDEGRYATVVTIPENFSAAATSLSGDPEDVETARIDIAEGDRGRLIDTALSSIVTQTATTVLNQQLGEQFVGGVYVGFNELGEGLTEAADGAGQLASGSRQLGEGAGELADGASQLADGTQQLASGSEQLAGGAGELATGSAELASGVGAYVDGASQLSDAYEPLAEGTTATVTQLQQLIGALGQLQTDTTQPQADLTNGMTTAGAGAAALGNNLAAFATEIEQLTADCMAEPDSADFCTSMATRLATQASALKANAAEIGTGLTTAQTGAEGLGEATASLQSALGGDSGGDPTAQLNELIDGVDQFGTALGDFADQGSQLAGGASQLAGGAGELADGASGLASGTSELAAGTPALADGAEQLADGIDQSAEGAGELAGGLDEAVAGIPNTTEAERDRIAATAVAPVEAVGASDELFNASGVPLFAGIALWAGALAMFLLIRPLWGRTRDAARGVVAIALRSAAPAAALGAVQGALAGVILPLALGYDAAQGLRFFALAVIAGTSFSLLVQGLAALLGGVGRFIAFALLVVGFAVGIVSTAPAPLIAVGDASPIGAAFAGFQSVAAGAGMAGAAALLVLWGLAGLVLTLLAVRRARGSAAR